jgi:hypothetical protein
LVADLLDRSHVEHMLSQHCEGRRDYSFALWAVWVLARWGNTRTPDTRRPALTAAAHS